MKNLVTPEEIKNSVIKNNIDYWPVRRCLICNWPVSYIFENGLVKFDSNCDCSSYYHEPEIRSYTDIAELYNQSNSEKFKIEFLKFFKLEEE